MTDQNVGVGYAQMQREPGVHAHARAAKKNAQSAGGRALWRRILLVVPPRPERTLFFVDLVVLVVQINEIVIDFGVVFVLVIFVVFFVFVLVFVLLVVVEVVIVVVEVYVLIEIIILVVVEIVVEGFIVDIVIFARR
ncbi:MAG: hypothetical protein ABJF01_19320 [bacterium]